MPFTCECAKPCFAHSASRGPKSFSQALRLPRLAGPIYVTVAKGDSL